MAFDPHLRLPYTAQYNIALEQRLGRNQTLTASFVGSRGHDLLALLSYYPYYLGNLNFMPGNSADVVANIAESEYNALQVKFQCNLSHGLQVLASYTWSHSIDDATNNFAIPQRIWVRNEHTCKPEWRAELTVRDRRSTVGATVT